MAMKLTEEFVKKSVAEKKGIRFMTEQTGATKEQVKELLTKLGLKTRSMTEAQSRKSVSFQSLMMVYDAIREGAQDNEMIRMATDLPIEVVTTSVAKMKRDGTIKNVYAIAKRAAPAATQPVNAPTVAQTVTQTQ